MGILLSNSMRIVLFPTIAHYHHRIHSQKNCQNLNLQHLSINTTPTNNFFPYTATSKFRHRVIPLDEEESLLEPLELLELLLARPPPTSFSISTGGKLLIGMSSPMSTSSSPASPFFGLFGSSTSSFLSCTGNSYKTKQNHD